MAVISVADLNLILDDLGRAYVRAVGTSASGMGLGTIGGAWGVAGAVQGFKSTLLGMTDLEPINALVQRVVELEARVSGATYAASEFGAFLTALQSHVVRAGGVTTVRTIEDWLVYRNTGEVTKWQCLAAPSVRDLFATWLSGSTPAVDQFYFEVLQGASYAHGLYSVVVGGASTDGAAIDETKYAGGFPQLRVSGLTGSATVTVTGTARDPAAKAFVTGRTWTASVSANGVVALAPGGGTAAPANSLITNVSAVSVPGGISAGTIYVEAARPTGRPLVG